MTPVVILRPECKGLVAHYSVREDGQVVIEIARPEAFPAGCCGIHGQSSDLDVLGVKAGRLVTFPESRVDDAKKGG